MWASDFEPAQIRWCNLWWVGLAFAARVAVIVSGDLLALNFLHIATGLLWTGIDLFMGVVVGPALRRAPFEARRAVMTQITPRTMFILPTISLITGTTGWYLAKEMGYLATSYPGSWSVIAALVVVTILTIQGLGILLPTQIRVYFELCDPAPARERVARLSGNYF